MRYFIKPLYADWKEVTLEQYERFREFLFKNIMTTTDAAKKEEIINRRTKIEK